MNTHYKVHGHALELANAFGFLYPSELFLIQAIARSLPEEAVVVCVGIGTGTGSLGVAEVRPDARIFSVDISEGGPLGGLENERIAFSRTTLALPTQILGDSQKVHAHWPEIGGGAQIDLLFIDADHSADGLQRDIDGWLPYVRSGGYALFHDYGSENWGDVKKVVDANLKGWRLVLAVDTLLAVKRGVK